MGGTGQNGFLVGVLAVDLGCFYDLQTLDSMSIAGEERATAGFSLILDHAAYAHGTVEQVVQRLGTLFWTQCLVAFGQFNIQFLLNELLDFLEGLGRNAFIQFVQVFEAFVLQTEEQSGKHFLVDDGGVLHPVGHHVVDVFDEDEVGTLFVEVFD